MRKKKADIPDVIELPTISKKNLTKNTSKINTSLEDVKRFIDGNARPEQKVQKIEEILANLYE